jgi:hypothetical protein
VLRQTPLLALSLGAHIDDADEEVRRVCDQHRFPLDDLLSARRRVMQMPGMEATMNQGDTMKRGLAAVSNLPAFLAALEGYSRRVSGGGSISMRLFQNETLTDVQVEGTRAWGTRVHGPGSSDAVEFVQRKGQWYVRLIARPRVIASCLADTPLFVREYSKWNEPPRSDRLE